MHHHISTPVLLKPIIPVFYAHIQLFKPEGTIIASEAHLNLTFITTQYIYKTWFTATSPCAIHHVSHGVEERLKSRWYCHKSIVTYVMAVLEVHIGDMQNVMATTEASGKESLHPPAPGQTPPSTVHCIRHRLTQPWAEGAINIEPMTHRLAPALEQ